MPKIKPLQVFLKKAVLINMLAQDSTHGQKRLKEKAAQPNFSKEYLKTQEKHLMEKAYYQRAQTTLPQAMCLMQC